MREIRPSGSEGGVALTPPSLPLSRIEFSFRGCLWPPAKAVCYRGVMLELAVRSDLRTIRRDAEWCDRDGRAPQIDSSVSRVGEPALYRRKAANCTKNEKHPSRD